MMREKMNIPKEDVERFQFERVHRISTRQDMVRSSKPRPIIVKLSFFTRTLNLCGPLLRTSKAVELELQTIF